MKPVIYTCVFGDSPFKHPLLDAPVNDDFDFICFTDREQSALGWQFIMCADDASTDKLMRLAVRKYKMNPHIYLPNHIQSVYQDCHIKIGPDMFPVILLELAKKDLIIYGNQNQTYNEKINHMLDIFLPKSSWSDKGEKAIILATQKQDYKNAVDTKTGKSKHDFRLMPDLDLNFILRNHQVPAVIDLMKKWWIEFQKYPYRDEISLPSLLKDTTANYAIKDSGEWFSRCSLVL